MSHRSRNPEEDPEQRDFGSGEEVELLWVRNDDVIRLLGPLYPKRMTHFTAER